MLVSVCMIVKNEESNMVRALSSIPSTYEKIVVDTGSTDQTIALASGCGAKVYSYPWNDDFAAARNIACSYCMGDYILVMDADEELPTDVGKLINEYVKEYPSQPGAVLLENVMDNEVKRHRMVRFFPNQPQYQFFGIVHEQLYQGEYPAPFISMNLTIQHYGYDSDYYHDKRKADRYLLLYQKHLDQFPNDGYMLYQMGKLLYSLHNYVEAEVYLQRGINQDEDNRLYFPVMLVMLGYCLKEQGKSPIAEQLLDQYAMQFHEFPDLPFLQGLLAMDTGKIDRIERLFLRALSIGDTTKYSSVVGVGSFKAAFNLGLFYEITGQKTMAQKYYVQSAKQGFSPAQERLAFLG